MIKQLSTAFLLGTCFLASPGYAQTATPAPDGGQFMTQMTADQWRGSKLVGVDVYGSDNAKIGDINEIVVDRGGAIKAIVIGVGGFLGIGEKNVAIPFDKVEWGRNDAASSTASATAPVAPSAGGVAQTTTGSNAPASTGAARQTTSAPSTVASSSTMHDYPDRATVRMSKQDLQSAPQFNYASSTSSNSGTAPATPR
ncbi:MAG: photosystem reaction center subunit [Hyphomicrobiales bacterium]|nr:photosystem reaction center subunit [Hyphomicrobiales bacterium]